MSTLYAGPGKLYMSALALYPEGENGQITATIEQSAADVVSGFHGRIGSLQANALGRISLTPFDNWAALPLLFPAYLGVTVGSTTGALAIGTRPEGAADVPCKIWAPDGRLYLFPRAAIVKHPDLHLAVNKSLFGPIEIAATIATGAALGSAHCLYTITESAAADPGGVFDGTFARSAWSGTWGTAAGFGGDQNGAPIQAEDEWLIQTIVKYTPLNVQSLTRAHKLDSVAFLAKVRPYGPTHTQIDAAIAINSATGLALGGQIAASATPSQAADLVLTAVNGKSITLKNAAPFGAGFDFGGARLGTGEVGFLSTVTFTTGAPNPLLIFSA